MFGSAIFETAVGLLLIYLLLSLIVSSLQESIEGWLKMRARYLRKGIIEMVSDSEKSGPQLVEALYNHPLIYCLFQGGYGKDQKGKNLPSYIPAANFAAALIDTLMKGATKATGQAAAAELSVETLRSAVHGNDKVPRPLQRALLLAVDSSAGDLAKAKANIEAWFNSGQEGVSAWYKTYTHWVAFGIGVVAAVGLNVDSIRIAKDLYRNDAVRAAIVAQARELTKDEKPPQSAGIAERTLEQMQLPIGWSTDRDLAKLNLTWGVPREGQRWKVVIDILKFIFLYRLPGWLMTASAITLGAPFWFDALNKMMVIRSTVKPHEKSPEESSEDRQTRGRQVARFQISSTGTSGKDTDSKE